MNFTKTPYLVLFILLAGIGIGAASALVTITLSGNVQVEGDLDVDGAITGPTIDSLQNQISTLQTQLCDPEICNGLDDDCDGLIDEGSICPDTETNCSDGIDDDGDMDVDCLDSDCNGMSCDDGLFCTGVDICSSGVCVSAGNPCQGPDGDMNCQESCDDTVDSCTANDPNNTVCGGSSGESCQAGICIACDPLSPSSVCGSDSHCYPSGTGIAVCTGPTGPGGQESGCFSNDDCLPEFACLEPDPGNGFQCLQLCKVGGQDCPSNTICASINQFIGAQEWGVCVP